MVFLANGDDFDVCQDYDDDYLDMNEEYYNEMDTNYDGLSEYDLDELIPLNILEHVLMPPTFYNGDFTTDMSFSLYYDDELGGELIASGIGSGVYSFTFNGTIYSNRESFLF